MLSGFPKRNRQTPGKTSSERGDAVVCAANGMFCWRAAAPAVTDKNRRRCMTALYPTYGGTLKRYRAALFKFSTKDKKPVNNSAISASKHVRNDGTDVS